jgi:hypothetical protein
MSDNTLNKALLIMSCDSPRRRLLRARFPLDRVDPAQRGERVRRRCNGSPIRLLRGEESVGGATRWCGACLATATRTLFAASIGMIENRGFDSHSLRHLHDFARQPTILGYLVRDSALLGLGACAGAIMQDLMPTQSWLRLRMRSCDQYGRTLLVSAVISKSRRSAQRRF